MLPPLTPEALFPTIRVGHAGTGSTQPGEFFFFFSFPTRRLRTVPLCENRLGQIFHYPFLLRCHGWGSREMLVWFSLSQSTKRLTFLPPLAAHMSVGTLLTFPLPYRGTTPVTLKPGYIIWQQTQDQAQKENKHQILLISAAAELMQGIARMNYKDHLVSRENRLHNATLLFIPHQASSQ